MILRDLIKAIDKKNIKKEQEKAARMAAIGIGAAAAAGIATGILLAPKSGKETREDLKKKTVATVESIKDNVQKNAEAVKDSTAYVVQGIGNIIKEIHDKAEEAEEAEEAGKDIKCTLITEDIQDFTENIPNELNESVK